MKVEKIICDCCGEEIPKAKKKDVFGIEREYYRMGKLNYGEPFTDINCQNLGLRYLYERYTEISVWKCIGEEWN